MSHQLQEFFRQNAVFLSISIFYVLTLAAFFDRPFYCKHITASTEGFIISYLGYSRCGVFSR